MAFEDDGDDARVRGFAGRLEVIEKPTGRRSWPDAVKARIVRESFAAGVTVSEVARRHRISPQHLTLWRRAAREGQLQLSFDGAADGGHGFVPVAVVEGGELPGRHADERISVEVDGVVLRLPTETVAARIAEIVLALGARR